MSVNGLPLSALRALVLALLGAGAGLAGTWTLATYEARIRRAITAHVAALESDRAYLRLRWSGRALASLEAGLLVLALAAAVLGSLLTGSVCLVLACAIKPQLTSRRTARTTRIEEQLDGWLLGLASTLRATPSLGEALESSMSLVDAPLREELETLVKEQKLGTPLDEALARMGARVGSRTLQSALGTLRIGRTTGGDIPHIVERSAAALREMARLEGIVRTKTAEGKAQAFVLALIPFPMIGLLHFIDPGFLAPLVASPRGYAVCAVSVVLWASALVLARRILDVDI